MPAGLAGYFQTTSWGEWFNVRITEFMIQPPPNGGSPPLVDQKEPQRGTTAAPAYTQCAGARGSNQSGSNSSPLGAAGGLAGLVGFALGGSNG